MCLTVALAALAWSCGEGQVVDTQPPATSSPGAVTDTSTTATTQPTTTTSTTPPSPTGALLVLGDWGAGTEAQAEVAAAMEELAGSLDVDAILTTGDNFYQDDETALMEPFLWAQEAVPFWIAWGNNDVSSEERIADINVVFGNPPRWTVHDWHGIDVLVLDSNQIDDQDQLAFIRETMAASSNPAIVAFHHPARSCSWHGTHRPVLERWVPLFDDDVFLVLSGHDHNYQRFVEGEVTYVVTGGGGARLYDLEACPAGHPEPVAGEASHHFLVLESTGAGVTLTAYRSDLTMIDTVELELP